MKKITKKELNEILNKHALRLAGDIGGEMADLSYTDLRGFDLSGLTLNIANFEGSDLRGTDLSHSYLCRADLRGADLRGANVLLSDFRKAKLEGIKINHYTIGISSEILSNKQENDDGK